MRKTLKDFIRARPSTATFKRDQMEDLIGDGVTPEEWVELDIPKSHKLWALIFVWLTPDQCLEFARECHLFADRLAGEVTEGTFQHLDAANKALFKSKWAQKSSQRAKEKGSPKAVAYWTWGAAMQVGRAVVYLDTAAQLPPTQILAWQITKALEILQKGEEK